MRKIQSQHVTPQDQVSLNSQRQNGWECEVTSLRPTSSQAGSVAVTRGHWNTASPQNSATAMKVSLKDNEDRVLQFMKQEKSLDLILWILQREFSFMALLSFSLNS